MCKVSEKQVLSSHAHLELQGALGRKALLQTEIRNSKLKKHKQTKNHKQTPNIFNDNLRHHSTWCTSFTVRDSCCSGI